MNIWTYNTPFNRASSADCMTIECFRWFSAMTWFTLYTVYAICNLCIFGNISRGTFRRLQFRHIVLFPRFDGQSSTYGLGCHCFAVNSAAYLARYAARCMRKRRADYLGNPIQGLPFSSLCRFYCIYAIILPDLLLCDFYCIKYCWNVLIQLKLNFGFWGNFSKFGIELIHLIRKNSWK